MLTTAETESTVQGDMLNFDFDFDVEDVPVINKVVVVTAPPEASVLCTNAGIGKVSKFAKHKRRNLKRLDYSNSLAMLKHGAKAPNMSRRVQRAALCAFPAFDKCDSLVFLPVSMARLMNSADTDGLRQLLESHIHKQCVINYKGVLMTLDPFMHIQEILSQTSPDHISCVHDTKVIDNTIHASLFCKFTENKLIYETVAPMYERDFPVVFSTASRRDRWIKKLNNSRVSDADRTHITELATIGADLVVYANMEWDFTFDFDTRKITRFDYHFYLVTVKDGRQSDLGGLDILLKL